MSSNKHPSSSSTSNGPLLSAWRFGLGLITLLAVSTLIALLLARMAQPATVSVIVPTMSALTAVPTATALSTPTPAPTATPDGRIPLIGQRVATVETHGHQVAVTVEALVETAGQHTAELDHLYQVWGWVGWAGLFLVGLLTAILVTSAVTTPRPHTPPQPPPPPHVADEFMAAGWQRALLRPLPPIERDARRMARLITELGLLERPTPLTQTAMLRELYPHFYGPHVHIPTHPNSGRNHSLIKKAIEIASSSSSSR